MLRLTVRQSIWIVLPTTLAVAVFAAASVRVILQPNNASPANESKGENGIPRETPVAFQVRRSISLGETVTESELIEVQTALQRIIDIEGRVTSWSGYLHALRLHADNLSSPSAILARRTLELICNSREIEETFGGVKYHSVTRHGVVLAVSPAMPRDSGIPLFFGDPHPNKALSVLAMAGVLSRHPVIIEDANYDVASLVSGAMAEFQSNDELPWTCIALSLYLPPNTSWRNRFGEKFCLEQLCQRLMEAPLHEGACFGLHIPFAIAVMLHADREVPYLSSSVRQEAIAYLRRISSRLPATQRDNGAWDAWWHGERENVATVSRASVQLVVTGHVVECLAALPPEIECDDVAVRRAVLFLTSRINSAADDELSSQFPVSTHAAMALRLWFPEVWDRLVSVAQ